MAPVPGEETPQQNEYMNQALILAELKAGNTEKIPKGLLSTCALACDLKGHITKTTIMYLNDSQCLDEFCRYYTGRWPLDPAIKTPQKPLIAAFGNLETAQKIPPETLKWENIVNVAKRLRTKPHNATKYIETALNTKPGYLPAGTGVAIATMLIVAGNYNLTAKTIQRSTATDAEAAASLLSKKCEPEETLPKPLEEAIWETCGGRPLLLKDLCKRKTNELQERTLTYLQQIEFVYIKTANETYCREMGELLNDITFGEQIHLVVPHLGGRRIASWLEGRWEANKPTPHLVEKMLETKQGMLAIHENNGIYLMQTFPIKQETAAALCARIPQVAELWVARKFPRNPPTPTALKIVLDDLIATTSYFFDGLANSSQETLDVIWKHPKLLKRLNGCGDRNNPHLQKMWEKIDTHLEKELGEHNVRTELAKTLAQNWPQSLDDLVRTCQCAVPKTNTARER